MLRTTLGLLNSASASSMYLAQLRARRTLEAGNALTGTISRSNRSSPHQLARRGRGRSRPLAVTSTFLTRLFTFPPFVDEIGTTQLLDFDDADMRASGSALARP